MDLKQFLKPTVTKVILFLILMIGLNYWIISATFIIDAMGLVGVPLGFWPVGSSPLIHTGDPIPPLVQFSWINFTIDIIFWYLLSCAVLSLLQNSKKK